MTVWPEGAGLQQNDLHTKLVLLFKKLLALRMPGNKVQNSAPQVKSVAVYFNNVQFHSKTNKFPESSLRHKMFILIGQPTCEAHPAYCPTDIEGPFNAGRVHETHS
jgi:hypothetical protein